MASSLVNLANISSALEAKFYCYVYMPFQDNVASLGFGVLGDHWDIQDGHFLAVFLFLHYFPKFKFWQIAATITAAVRLINNSNSIHDIKQKKQSFLQEPKHLRLYASMLSPVPMIS